MTREHLGFFDNVINRDVFGLDVFTTICENIYYEMEKDDLGETIIVFTDKDIKKYKRELKRYLYIFLLDKYEKIEQFYESNDMLEYTFIIDEVEKYFRIFIFSARDLMRGINSFRGYRSQVTILDVGLKTYESMDLEVYNFLRNMNIYSTLKNRSYYGMWLLYGKDDVNE